MTNPNYCRLYLDTSLSRPEIQAMLDEEIARRFRGLKVTGAVFKNHGFEPLNGRAYDPIAASAWTAEVDADRHDEGSFDVFQADVGRMIQALRMRGLIVTASCDFEDRIIEETGWNWTSATPDPPLRR